MFSCSSLPNSKLSQLTIQSETATQHRNEPFCTRALSLAQLQNTILKWIKSIDEQSTALKNEMHVHKFINLGLRANPYRHLIIFHRHLYCTHALMLTRLSGCLHWGFSFSIIVGRCLFEINLRQIWRETLTPTASVSCEEIPFTLIDFKTV